MKILWSRYLSISILKWFAQLLIGALILGLALPKTWSGYMLSVPMWLFAFILAFFFAEWAFKTRLPGQREIISLILVWMGVTLTLQILYSQFVLGSAIYLVNSFEIYVQYMFEVLAILLAARVVHRHKMNKALSEGLEV